MSEEQREILKMVADGVITVEEAERLLRALDEGARAREGQRHQGRRTVSGALEALGDLVAEIGPLVRNAVEDAITGIGLGVGEGDEPEGEFAPWDGEPIALSEGTTVDISHARGHRLVVRRATDLVIEGVPGDHCSIDATRAQGVRERLHAGRLQIRWSEGDLVVRVPKTAGKVVARMMGGSIRACGLPCPSHLRTLGGSLELEGVDASCDAKAVGGSITLGLCPGFRGDGRLHAVGASIVATVPHDVRCALHAVTVGGSIEVEGAATELERSRAVGKQVVDLVFGGEPIDASLALHSVGGTITVRRIRA